MRNRISFHKALKTMVGDTSVYYQPPINLKLVPPYIVYNDDSENVQYSNNRQYRKHTSYSVQLITLDPDDPLIDEILKLPYSRKDRHHVVDRLHHFVFTINF